MDSRPDLGSHDPLELTEFIWDRARMHSQGSTCDD